MPRSKSADRDRFNQLYADNLPLILGYALRRCADRSDAADVAAEVFLTLWRRLDDVPQNDERLWLFGVARRVLANQRRGQIRRSDLAERLRMELLTRSSRATADESTVVVVQATAQLPARDRELLALSVWDGLSPSEIAALEGIPAATVRSQLMRARARLRQLLQGSAPALPRVFTAPSTVPDLRSDKD